MYSQHGPDDDHGWKPNARRDLLDNYPMGKLTDGHTIEKSHYDFLDVVSPEI
jgi:hypothetical protein